MEAEAITKHVSELSDKQRLEAFVNKSLKQYRDQMTLQGWQRSGKKLNEEEMISSIKLYCQSTKKEEDYEVLARELGFDIEQAA